jgi:hypothetical protein
LISVHTRDEVYFIQTLCDPIFQRLEAEAERLFFSGILVSFAKRIKLTRNDITEILLKEENLGSGEVTLFALHLFFLFWTLHYLFLIDLRLLTTTLASSNFSLY